MLLATGCCIRHPGTIQPSFAGVPQAIVRSPDYPLPLSAAHQEQLLAFVASDGNRFQMACEPPELAALDRVRADYGDLIAELGRRAPTPADLRPGAAFSALFDEGVAPMTIHDARLGWENGELVQVRTGDLTGLVKHRYVFAFYARRLAPPTGDPTSPTDSWWLAPRAVDDAFTGLVVFLRSYAIPEPVR